MTLLATPNLRVAHVMRHTSLKNSVLNLTKEKIIETVLQTKSGMEKVYNIDPIRFMIAGLNPHNGDNGLMGREEEDIIIPAINELKEMGIQILGPIAADSAFPKAILGEADIVIALYHDQGHIAIKASNWKQSHGITLGLPVIRTSADHGSALDIAGQNRAYEDSLLEALKVCISLSNKN